MLGFNIASAHLNSEQPLHLGLLLTEEQAGCIIFSRSALGGGGGTPRRSKPIPLARLSNQEKEGMAKREQGQRHGSKRKAAL